MGFSIGCVCVCVCVCTRAHMYGEAYGRSMISDFQKTNFESIYKILHSRFPLFLQNVHSP